MDITPEERDQIREQIYKEEKEKREGDVRVVWPWNVDRDMV